MMFSQFGDNGVLFKVVQTESLTGGGNFMYKLNFKRLLRPT